MGPEFAGIGLAQSWAEAFTALGTVSAFMIGAFAFRRQQLDRRDDETAQARQVLPGRAYRVRSLVRSARAGGDHILTFSAVNYSSQHIYQVLIRRIADRPGRWGDPVIGYITAHSAEAVAPGESQRLYEVYSDEPLNEYDWAIEFEFVDAKGRRWVRRGLDQPRRLRQHSRIRQLKSGTQGRRH